jgi:hypothetical protein
MKVEIIGSRLLLIVSLALAMASGAVRAQDVGVSAIASPPAVASGCAALGTSVPVTVVVRNFGASTIPAGTAIPMRYVLNGGTPVNATLTTVSSLAPSANTVYTFPAAFNLNLSALAPAVISVSTNLATDPAAANDGQTRVVRSLVTSFPWVESFDSLPSPISGTTVAPPYWMQDLADGSGIDSNWYFRNGPGSTFGAGPAADHTSGTSGQGFYAVVDDDGSFAQVRLLTPCIDLSLCPNPVLSFWYHSVNGGLPGNASSLSVDVVSQPSGAVTANVTPAIGTVPGGWQRAIVSLGGLGGVVQIVFRARTDGGANLHDVAIDDVRVGTGFTTDLALEAIVAPASSVTCSALGTTELVTIRVRNEGTAVLSPGTTFTASYALDGGAPVAGTFVLPQPMPFTGSQVFAFPAPADLSALGQHTLAASISLATDQNPANDALTGYIVTSGGEGLIASFPWSESFGQMIATPTTQPPPYWQQDPLDGASSFADWYFASAGTPAGAAPYPAADHTTGLTGAGAFAYVNDDSNDSAVNLLTPCLLIGTLARPTLSFWVHSSVVQSQAPSFLHVDVVRYPSGQIVPDVVPVIGPAGAGWKIAVADLTPHGALVRIRFRVNSQNSASVHGIAIDDVRIGEGNPPGSGEDLRLLSLVDGAGVAILGGKTAGAGDFIELTMDSEGGGYWGFPPILAGQLFVTGQPPAGLGQFGFPEVHLQIAATQILFDGASMGLFGTTVLGPGGISLGLLVPAGGAGYTARVQCLAIDAGAANGVFAISDAHDFILM